MKKLTSILAAALAIAGCQPVAEDPADAYRKALPSAASVQLGVPDSEGTSGTALTLNVPGPTGALIDPGSYRSEYAIVSYWTALTVNVGTWWTLELVKFITAHPATTCDDTSCTWGPWLGDDNLNFWKFHAVKANGGYDWALSLQPASAPLDPWVDLIAGHAVPGADRDHGSGSFVIDFDAQDSLPHPEGWVKEDYGTLEITYDNTTSVSIQATLTGGRSDDPADLGHEMNAVYDFNDTGAGGELQFAFEDVTDTESISMRTRWTATGAGRADAHYSDPDAVGGPLDYYASECWAGAAYAWAETYDTKYATGSENSCAFIPASYSDLTLP